MDDDEEEEEDEEEIESLLRQQEGGGEAAVGTSKRLSSNAKSVASTAAGTKQEQKTKKKKRSRMTFLQRLIARILDNLSVTVEGLHIRFEDRETLPNSHFAFGAKIEELTVSTVGSNEDLASSSKSSGANAAPIVVFVDRTTRPPPDSLRRRVRVKGFSCYWEPLTSSSNHHRV